MSVTFQMFERVRNTQPEAFKKIVALNGDVNTINLGLDTTITDALSIEVNIVFHLAATLKLEANLKDALEHNTMGTIRVIEICRKMKNLEGFLHFSTAFCSADVDVFEERVSMTGDQFFC